MLKKSLENYISETVKEDNVIELFQEEKEYAEKNNLLGEEIIIKERSEDTRFLTAYIERGDKETEEFLGEENPAFLNQSIDYFKKNKNEFMYLESEWFGLLKVDAVSFEADDVFGTYDVMLGLKLQKKYEAALKNRLKASLKEEEAKFDVMFDANEGLWNVNFALNDVAGYKEDMTIQQAYILIYRFLFSLVEAVENAE
ncbi:branched-chain amino acid aminotransferase [Mesobacillus foraminis]|uniref:branched-chain amino acid aminotransferase n=1 Tax=Mesobacillus foraminis TaxID=279826 RepID=UPI000EF51BDE|nr:branched-chain amino acid aminotransferase [Mesobacillus foraminis]